MNLRWLRALLLFTVLTSVVLASTVATTGATTFATTDTRASKAPPAPPADTAPCAGPNGVGGSVPAGLGPGDLVAAVDLTPRHEKSPGFPTSSRVWRVLYVSTGVDEYDLQLICGMVAAPKDGPAAENGVGHMLTWSHGTVGLAQSCLPSSNPASEFWGPMAGGIGAIAYTDGIGKRTGKPQDGLLQYAMNKGWMVAASDYQPNNAYIVGKIAAANQLDVMRAASQLMRQDFTTKAPTSFDTVVWGHSQGGHAAMWTGQLFESYLAGTMPSQPTASFNLKGVALLAPATNFITQPDRQPGVEFGDGLIDSEMHQTLKPLGIPLAFAEVQIGPALLSYAFGSWSALSNNTRQPAADAKFPAAPLTNAPLALDAVATKVGRATIREVLPLCLNKSGSGAVKAATAKYRNASTNRMLVSALWNLPADYKTGEYFKGSLDKTCATTSDTSLRSWCTWTTWNLPGPLGVNPYPKWPTVADQPVPLMIAQGSDDTIVHCVAPRGSRNKQVPAASDCMSSAFYDTLATEAYCPISGTGGHLEFNVFRKTGFFSPASHFAIPGEASAKNLGRSKSGLVFTGSLIQRFMTRAFAGSLAPGCTASVVNP